MVDYILKDGSFAARAVTRNPDSPSAKGLIYVLIHLVNLILYSPRGQGGRSRPSRSE